LLGRNAQEIFNMASLEKLFGTSRKLEEEGVRVELGEGFWVRVARDSNQKARQLWQSKMRHHRTQLRNRNLPPDVMERIGIEVMAEAVLLEWGGAQDGGTEVAYSRSSAVAMLTKYPDFRLQVAELSADMTLFQEEDEEAARKNSPPPSDGTSSSGQ
jgi:hypothetical protein